MEFEHKVGALDDEDLVVGEKEEKNWKGIVISLLVIGSILGAIIVAIILCTPEGDTDNNRMKLDLDHVISDGFKVQTFNGTWLSENEIVYVDQNGSIVIFDAATNKSSLMLVKTYDKTLHTMGSFKLSSDRQSILFVTDLHRHFGAPISARYAIYNISSQTVEYLDDLIKFNYANRIPQIQYATWGSTANSILFIESNDIYIVPNFAQSRDSNYLRLTKRGAMSDSIINGLPDSLYRQYIYNEPNEATLWWSPNGRYLAYLTFDDSLVEPSPIEYYDSFLTETNNNPKIHSERYPHAGDKNPRVSVHVADLRSIGSSSSPETSSVPSTLLHYEDVESATIPPPIELVVQQQNDPRLSHYVTYVGWLQNSQLLVMWSNRAQNNSILSLCETNETFGGRMSHNWKCEILTTFSQRIPPSRNARKTILGAVDKNGTRLIFFALPRPDSVIGDHYHVAMLRGDEPAPKYLTHGEFDVDRLISYDVQTDCLYFEAQVSEQAERHLYKISSIGQIASRQTKCLTCELEEPCGYNYVHIGPSSKYLVHECFGPSIPSTRMRLINSTSDKLDSQHVLVSNQHIHQLVMAKQMPIERFIAIKPDSQIPYYFRIKMYLPNEIEDEKDKRFPMLIESTEIEQRNVWKRFDLDWGKYLASRKQMIYVRVDCIRSRSHSANAATGSVGAPLSSISNVNGGAYSSQLSSSGMRSGRGEETETVLMNAKDQIDVIKFLIENNDQFPFIDRRRIAIWGPTSTSAYVALATTLSDDTKLIQCTIGVSPITNWRYMSSFLAEYYLGLPWVDSNSLKYERTNLLKRGHEFLNRKLLIIHGTADEQVHVQHSMQFIKALTSEHHYANGIMHQMQLYPDVGHSLEQVKRHYYMTLDGFVDRCFYQKPMTTKATEWKGKVRPKLY